MKQKERMSAQPQRTMLGLGAGTIPAMALGAALAYLFDPQQGRSRRARLRDQLPARTRRAGEGVAQPARSTAQVAQDKAKGRAEQAKQPDTGPESDRALVDKVRSEVLGSEEFRGETINVMAADGTVTLRGQLKRPEQIRALRERVAKVKGVRRVESFLHTPGTPPPNKAELWEASDQALRRAATGDSVQHTPD